MNISFTKSDFLFLLYIYIDSKLSLTPPIVHRETSPRLLVWAIIIFTKLLAEVVGPWLDTASTTLLVIIQVVEIISILMNIATTQR